MKEGLELEQRLPELEREIKGKEEELENLKKIIPSDREAEDLIRKLERMAARDQHHGQELPARSSQVPKEFYFEWPIAIAGGRLVPQRRQVLLEDQQLRAAHQRPERDPHGRPGAPTRPRRSTATFKAVTYVYKEK